MKYVVRCADFTTKSFASREQAERLVEALGEGGLCPLDHEVVEVES